MYKYTSSRFKTRAEQEVKKAEHVARIGNATLGAGVGWGRGASGVCCLSAKWGSRKRLSPQLRDKAGLLKHSSVPFQPLSLQANSLSISSF